MKGDEKNGAAITRKALDFGVLSTIKLRPLCHLHLERCIRSNGIPTFCQK
jgi:hypothetical protein